MTTKKKAQKAGARGKGDTDARRLPSYPAEIEVRRADYTAAGVALRNLEFLDLDTVGGIDIAPDGALTDEHEPHIIYTAVRQHLDALCHDLLMNYERDFWTTFYVEMRLYLDHCRANLKAGTRHAKKGGADGNG